MTKKDDKIKELERLVAELQVELSICEEIIRWYGGNIIKMPEA